MGLYDQELLKRYREIGAPAVARQIKKIANEKGVSLSDEDVSAIERMVISGEIDVSSEQEQGELARQPVVLDIADVKLIVQAYKDALSSYETPEFLESFAQSKSNEGLTDLESRWDGIFQDRDTERIDLECEIARKWGKVFARFEQMVYLLFNMCNEGFDAASEKTEAQKKHEVSAEDRFFHVASARICQLGHEVISLVKSGYAEAALSRWRSMHEMNVISSFILEQGGDIAARYLDHEACESLRASREYNQHADVLGFAPLSGDEISLLEQTVDRLSEKYGRSFRRNYGWAAAALDKQNPTFADIEKAAGYNHMRGYYRMASHGVHSNPKCLTFRPSQPSYTDAPIAGPSAFGLEDPIQLAALTMMQFATLLTVKWPSADVLVLSNSITKLNEIIQNEISLKIDEDSED